MADISKIKAINGTTYDIKDTTARNKTTNQISRPEYLTGVIDPTIAPQINDLRANRLAFLPSDQIIIEKTTDGGETWVDAGMSDTAKNGLFSEVRVTVSIPQINGQKNILCGLRITFTAMKYNVPSGTAETEKYAYWNNNYVTVTERYNKIGEMYFWLSSGPDRITVKLERATGAKPNNWVIAFDNTNCLMSGWSGNDYIRFGESVFGGGITQTGNYWNYRLTFMSAYAPGASEFNPNSITQAQSISEVRGYGSAWWTAGNKYAASDHMYSWDSSKNVTFPARVSATNFSGDGSSLTALNASNLSSGTVSSARLPVATSSVAGAIKVGTNLSISNGILSATDTTYESKTAASGGTDVSLVTTGEKYTWNNMRQVPAVSTSDNGKVLRVVSGAWAAVELPSASGVSF